LGFKVILILINENDLLTIFSFWCSLAAKKFRNETMLENIESKENRNLIDFFLKQFEELVEPKIELFQKSIIHGVSIVVFSNSIF
jgi:hypothetical protein